MFKKPALLPSTPDFSLVSDLKKFGYRKIIGVDEVGRGAIAGPIVVAAIEVNELVSGVTDSKLLSAKKRNLLATGLHRSSLINFGSASSNEIDEFGLSEAQRLAYSRALNGLEFDLVLTDHYNPPTTKEFIRATKGEKLFYPVAAASIIAKVYRDQLMKVYAKIFPMFGWEQNVGYATKYHLAQIRKVGKTSIHRHSIVHK